MTATTSILVASDGSDAALRAVTAAGDLARALGAQVTVIFVEDEQLIMPHAWGLGEFPAGQPAAWTSVEAIRDRLETRARDEEFPKALAALGELSEPAECVHRWGHPAEEICRYAEESDVDHLVVGSRGRGTFRRALLGSVSQAVAAHAKCPVTIVH